jgi:hypothetical protein
MDHNEIILLEVEYDFFYEQKYLCNIKIITYSRTNKKKEMETMHSINLI